MSYTSGNLAGLDPDTTAEVVAGLGDDELRVLLDHTWPIVRKAAEREASQRWAETIMPKAAR